MIEDGPYKDTLKDNKNNKLRATNLECDVRTTEYFGF